MCDENGPTNIGYDYDCILHTLSRVLTRPQVTQLCRVLKLYSEDEIIRSIEAYRRGTRSPESCRECIELIFLGGILEKSRSSTIEQSSENCDLISPADTLIQSDTEESLPFPSPLVLSSFNSPTAPWLISLGNPQTHMWHCCIACNVRCKSVQGLEKHQHEFCERKRDWVCAECGKRFGLQDRLERHHLDTHTGTCPYNCNKQTRVLGEQCKTQLAACTEDAPEKKAWGCPCCLKCFKDQTSWNSHKDIHRTWNHVVENWSFTTMVRSLLTQSYLAVAAAPYPWQSCDWSTLGKDTRQTLRFALERLTIPSSARDDPKFAHHDYRHVLVCYAFSLAAKGPAYARICDSSGESLSSMGTLLPSFTNQYAYTPTAQYPSSMYRQGTIPGLGHARRSGLDGACQDLSSSQVSGALPVPQNTVVPNWSDPSSQGLPQIDNTLPVDWSDPNSQGLTKLDTNTVTNKTPWTKHEWDGEISVDLTMDDADYSRLCPGPVQRSWQPRHHSTAPIHRMRGPPSTRVAVPLRQRRHGKVQQRTQTQGLPFKQKLHYAPEDGTWQLPTMHSEVRDDPAE